MPILAIIYTGFLCALLLFAIIAFIVESIRYSPDRMAYRVHKDMSSRQRDFSVEEVKYITPTPITYEEFIKKFNEHDWMASKQYVNSVFGVETYEDVQKYGSVTEINHIHADIWWFDATLYVADSLKTYKRCCDYISQQYDKMYKWEDNSECIERRREPYENKEMMMLISKQIDEINSHNNRIYEQSHSK